MTKAFFFALVVASLAANEPTTQPIPAFCKVKSATLSTDGRFRKELELTKISLSQAELATLGSFFTTDRAGGSGGWTCAVKFQFVYEDGRTASIGVDTNFKRWACQEDGLGDRLMHPGLRGEIIRMASNRKHD